MKLKFNPFAAALALSVAPVTSISAASLYWKTSTAAAWDSASWASAPGGTYDQSWVSGSDAVFEDNLGTALTIAGPAAPTNFTSITANENVTLTPSSTLGTGGTVALIHVADGKTLNFAGQALSTAAGTGFTKNGPGTWSLANGNTYPGGFTLNAGTVAVGNVNALGAGGSLTLNGGTLRATDANARNLTGKFTSIVFGGDITLGDTTNNGALTFSNATDLGATTRTLTVNSAVTHTGNIIGSVGAGITKTGPGVLTLGGTNTYTGATTISGGVLTINNTGALPGFSTNGSYSVASGAALAVSNTITDADITTLLGTTNFAPGSAIGFDTAAASRAYAVVLANTAQGSLGLVKLGGNTLTLSTANTFTGAINISGGSLVVAHNNALGSGSSAITIGAGANLNLNTAVTLAQTGTITMVPTGNGTGTRSTINQTGTATLSNNIQLDYSGLTGAGNAFAQIAGTAAGVFNGSVTFAAGKASATGANNIFVLRGSNSVAKATGTIDLLTNNTVSNQGTLRIVDGAAAWELSGSGNRWTTLDFSSSTAAQRLFVGAANTLSAEGMLTNSNTTAGSIGTLRLNDIADTAGFNQTILGIQDGSIGKVAVTSTKAATLTLAGSGTYASSGIISGSVSLVKSGTGTQTLTGVNTYTGSTTINGGTLALGTTGVIPSASDLTISSATLDLRKGTAGRAQAVNNLSLSAATLVVGLNVEPDRIDVAGTATISGTNTIKLQGSTPVGTYNLIATQGPLSGTFVLDTSGVTVSGFPTTYSGAISGDNYVLTVSGAATPMTAYWKGDVSSVWNDSSAAPNSNWAADGTAGSADTGQVAGAITDVYFSNATASNTNTTLGADTSIYSLTFESGSATVGGAQTLTILTPSGNGLNVLSGASATLNTGSIVCTTICAVQAGGTLTVNGGGLGSGPLMVDGTLNLNMNTTNASLSGLGTVSRSIAGTGNLTINGSTNSTFDGAITDGAGVMALVKGGTSTLTLAGSSTYSGGTTVSQASNAPGITVANAAALGSGPVVANGSQMFSSTVGVSPNVTVANALTLKRGFGSSNRVVLGLGSGSVWSGPITLDNSGANGFAVITCGGTNAATASIVSGNIGYSTLGTGSAGAPHLVLRNGGTFGKVSGSVSLATGYFQILDASQWEFSNASNTWGTLDINHAGAIVTVGATNTLSPSGVVASTAGGTLRLNGQDGATAYDQSIAGLSGNVNVGLATGAATLTVNPTADQSTSGAISGAISLVKTGAAVQTLTGLNTYTGNTTVNAGTLALADNAQLKFSIGATSGINNSISGAGTVTLDGDFNIDTALVDASALTSGSWILENTPSLPGAYGDTFQVTSGTTAWTAAGNVWTKTVGARSYSFDETTGILTLTSSGGGGFESWAASKGLTGGGAAFDADPDNDGLANGLEFVLGGEPNPANPGANSAALLPTVSQTGGNLIFTFKRKDISESAASLAFQWSTNLIFPSPANDVPIGAADSTTDTITVDVTEDLPNDDTDTIVITIPAAKAAGGRIFSRLRAVAAP